MNTWKKWFEGSKALTIDAKVRYVNLDTFLKITLATQTGKNHDKVVGKVLDEKEFSWCGSDLHERTTLVKYGKFEYVVIEKKHQDQPYVMRANREIFAQRVARTMEQASWQPVNVVHKPCHCHNCQAGKFSGETYRSI